MEDFVLFHGGCHHCTMQTKNGLGYCVGCRFFDNDHTLPDLNDHHEKERDRMSKIRESAIFLASLKTN